MVIDLRPLKLRTHQAMRSFRLRFGKLKLLSWKLCTPPTHILIPSTLKLSFHASTGQGHQMTRSHKPSNLPTLAALPRPIPRSVHSFYFPPA